MLLWRLVADRISVGASMTDALDKFISDRKIEPQIAIKMLQHFDRIVAEVLSEKVKARMSFKVLGIPHVVYVFQD